MHTHTSFPFEIDDDIRGRHNDDHDGDGGADNDDNRRKWAKKKRLKPEYSLGWRRRRYVCRAARRDERLVIPVPGHAGEGLNTLRGRPMKLFSVAYRGHEFTAINPRSHVLLRRTSCFL